MKLVVLEGAKKGAAVPLKKDRFTIGRSTECSLRAGSDAISRQHCELLRTDRGVTVRDLGSRNGTYVNDEKIEGERLLCNGDRLRIGPLEFRYDAEGELHAAKKPKVGSVGEAVARSAGRDPAKDSAVLEDSISDWLLGSSAAKGDAPEVGETLSMRTDETRELMRQAREAAEAEAQAAEADARAITDETPSDETAADSKVGGKKPGKLPFRPPAMQAKDSREAAAQILRDMARRR